ncbi:12489_t:CDS:2, partial [Ambispora leptoticha]
MVNAQEYINEKYPKDGVCKSGSDKENKGKKRDEIIVLDLSKGKVGKGLFNNDGKTLDGSLKLESFTSLQKLIISSQQITSLDLNDCPNLKEVDLSNCPKELVENKDAIKSHLVFNIKKTKLIKGPIITPAGENVRNFEEVFLEGKYGVSKTKGFQKNDEPFEWNGKKYYLIDNIGFGDTSKDSIKEEDILKRVGEGIYSAQEGINQILFVVKGRFTEKHIEAFKLFENFISDTGIAKFTTIVKTGFSNFRDPESRERDKKALIRENKDLKEIIESCSNIIHVDNPAMTDGKEKIEKEKSNLFKELRIKLRLKTKKILLIGRSGRGKSTLANVLINQVDENEKFKKFEQLFEEGDLSVSQTRNIQSEKFEQEFTKQEELKKISYQVIDTPGIGDTKLSPEEILDIIGEAVYLVREGVDRVFFVTNDRFDQHETATYDLLRKAIFDDQITKHTTIVRTNFAAFKNKRECENDIKEMKENDSLKEVIESCQGRVIHVDNPPINTKGASEEEIELNKSKRGDTKKLLLDHLEKTCQENVYKPQNLIELSEKIQKIIEKKKKLGEALDKLKEQLKIVEGKVRGEKLLQVIKDLNEEIEKKNVAIRRAIFEHVQSKVNNKELKHIAENKEETNESTTPKKIKGKDSEVKLEGEETISSINTANESKEEDAELSKAITEIITDLIEEE